MKRRFALWFSRTQPVDRRDYALSGFGLMAFKYLTDAVLIYLVLGILWTPLEYLSPLLTTRTKLEHLILPLAVWTLPFLWIGVSMTTRRALDAGFSAWTGLLFFVPIINYMFAIFLCAVPSKAADPNPAPQNAGEGRLFVDALPAAAAGVGFGVAMTLFSVYVVGAYNASLFLGTPFAMGFAAAYLFNRNGGHGIGPSVVVAHTCVLLAGGILLVFSLEGAICLLMAYIPATALSALGALLGVTVAGAPRLRPSQAMLLLASLPFLTGAEAVQRELPLREVSTSLTIDASPREIWPHVIEFAELAEPSRWVFDLGIAYPMRARIEGRGVGAVRYCEFSTGAFVEPITAWEEPHRLAFDVARQPEPMHEWSPYQTVNAPHLLEGIVSKRGEFRLIDLGDGRTRLEGSTWYVLDMAPGFYWALWSDALIHSIHGRVLDHIAAEVEAG